MIEVIARSSIKPTDKVFQLKPFQDKFIFSDKRYCAFVGSWGTGKDMCTIARGMNLSQKYPNNNGMIARVTLKDLEDSTMRDFKDYTGLAINSKRDAKLGNGSTIMFRHAEELADEKNLNNMNLGWVAFIQADEFETDYPFLKACGRLRRCHGCGRPYNPVSKKNECNCYQSGFLSANVNGEDWISRLFGSLELGIKGKLGEDVADLVEANSFENADVLPRAYVDSWEQIRSASPEMFERYIMNSRKVSDEKFVVLPLTMVRGCVGNEPVKLPVTKRITVCDPAEGDFDADSSDDDGEGGGDETVIYDLENAVKTGEEIYKHVTPMDTIGRIQAHAQRNGSTLICIDKCGLGGAMYARLLEIYEGQSWMTVYGFDSRLSAPKGFEDNYANFKAYAWFRARDNYYAAKAVAQPADPEMIRQLSKMRYRFTSGGRGGKYTLWPKKKMKKILGCSPDRADAWIMALEALDHANGSGLGASDEGDSAVSMHPFYRKAMMQTQRVAGRFR